MCIRDRSTKEQLRRLEEEDLPNMLNEIGISKFETQDGLLKIDLKNFYRGHISKEKHSRVLKQDRKSGGLRNPRLSTVKGRKNNIIRVEDWKGK